MPVEMLNELLLLNGLALLALLILWGFCYRALLEVLERLGELPERRAHDSSAEEYEEF